MKHSQRQRELHGIRVCCLRTNYGLSTAEARALVDAMPASCEICGSDRKLEYDHDHATGKHRGWLCGLCNKGLSRFKDDPALLRAAAAYLEAAE